MRTLGVDLASQPTRTAACVVRWEAGSAFVEELRLGSDDEHLVGLAEDVQAVGIDSPFGWPDAFVDLLTGSHAVARWSDTARDRLRFRDTDRAVRRATGRWPLSVSSDLIAVPAMRCQGLLEHLNVTDRSGDGHVWEVYPAASLVQWGLTSRGYKRRRGVAVLSRVADDLLSRVPWLHLGTEERHVLRTSDDGFDALVASLTARAAALGLTEPPPPESTDIAAREGWIAVPLRGSLERLIV